jgi:hypothetical protein
MCFINRYMLAWYSPRIDEYYLMCHVSKSDNGGSSFLQSLLIAIQQKNTHVLFCFS